MNAIALVCLALVMLMLNWPAFAQEPLAKFIERFNGVAVSLGPQSDRCGIRDQDRYAGSVNDGLIKAGLQRSPAALSSAYLFIWGMPFGMFNQQCAIYMSLRLGADIPGKVVSIEAIAADEKLLVEQVKTLEGSFPGTFWTSSSLYVHLGGGTEDSVAKTVDFLVEEFKKARGG